MTTLREYEAQLAQGKYQQPQNSVDDLRGMMNYFQDPNVQRFLQKRIDEKLVQEAPIGMNVQQQWDSDPYGYVNNTGWEDLQPMFGGQPTVQQTAQPITQPIPSVVSTNAAGQNIMSDGTIVNTPERYAMLAQKYGRVAQPVQQQLSEADKWRRMSPAMQQRLLRTAGGANIPAYQAYLREEELKQQQAAAAAEAERQRQYLEWLRNQKTGGGDGNKGDGEKDNTKKITQEDINARNDVDYFDINFNPSYVDNAVQQQTTPEGATVVKVQGPIPPKYIQERTNRIQNRGTTEKTIQGVKDFIAGISAKVKENQEAKANLKLPRYEQKLPPNTQNLVYVKDEDKAYASK